MAFLLGLVPEFLAGAEAVGVGVTEATGSSIAGSAVQGAVVGQAGNVANEAGSSLFSKGVDKIFGEGTAESLSKKAHKAAQLGSSFYDYTTEGTYGSDPTKIDPLTQAVNINRPKPENVCKGEQHADARESGKDLGTFISKTATEMSFAEPGDNVISTIYTKVFGTNPLLAYLAGPLEKFQAGLTLPTNERYLEIAKTYNGKNLTFENVLETINSDGTKDYSAKDETGVVYTWFGKWNTHKVVPPIWGTWTGINSPNNTKPVSLLDLFAFFHDIDYKLYGNFNEQADYKLLARVYNNLDRMGPNERQIALTTVKYFSTIGAAARTYAGNPGTITVSPGIQQDDSFLPHIVDELPQKPEDYSELKKHFIDGMMEGLITESITSGIPSMNVDHTNYRTNVLLNIIDNLQVQIV
jgi:hypothetical protein